MGILESDDRGRRPVRFAALTRAATGAVFAVHSLAHAVGALSAAAEAGCPIILISAPGAGLYAGPRWWRALIEAARAAVPAARCTAMLDCADDAGAAQGAIRTGVEAIVFTGRAEIAERLADIAGQKGATIVAERLTATFDLGVVFFADAEMLRRLCAEVLAQASAA